MDLGFVLDSSGSLRNEYGKEKKFLTEIADAFGISPSGSRAGVVTFSHVAEHSIKLRDHMSTRSFNQAVNAIPHMGYTTRIDLALKLAQREMFAYRNGGRSGVKKVLIVLTDGSQTKTYGAADPAVVAEDIRRTGITVLVIGVGRGINRRELDSIAGGPNKAFTADSFDILIGQDFERRVLGTICVTAPPGMTKFSF